MSMMLLTAQFVFVCRSVAADVKGIQPAVTEVIAVQGGVLVVPLRAQRSGANWPTAPVAKCADGLELHGIMVLIQHEDQRRAADVLNHWTQDARSLTVRAMTASDESGGVGAGNGLGPCAVFDLPQDVKGDVQLFGGTVRISFLPDGPNTHVETDAEIHDVNVEAGDTKNDVNNNARNNAAATDEAGLAARPQPSMRIWQNDLPDPESPFEFWRWQLVRGDADWMSGAQDEAIDGGSADDVARRLIAEHAAGLWRAGFARLEKADPGTAKRCKELLSCHSLVGHDELATWIMDPVQTGALLRVMVNSRIDERKMIVDVKQWIQAQQDVLAWIDRVLPDGVTVNVAVRGQGEREVDLQWEDDPDGTYARKVTVDGRAAAQVTMLVPFSHDAAGESTGERETDNLTEARRRAERDAAALGRILLVKTGTGDNAAVMRIPVATDAGIVKPPGVFVGPFAPAPNLAEAARGEIHSISSDRTTTANIRRVNGRWEVFFECRRPIAPSASQPVSVKESDSSDLV
ncbi:MAG TPA: hypothetical protein VG711_08715, partial [Phycisphaerales bacterium]|nr:hypothetical protein [Phycisphaerales bacterium]